MSSGMAERGAIPPPFTICDGRATAVSQRRRDICRLFRHLQADQNRWNPYDTAACSMVVNYLSRLGLNKSPGREDFCLTAEAGPHGIDHVGRHESIGIFVDFMQ